MPPKKYATEEERKEARRLQSREQARKCREDPECHQRLKTANAQWRERHREAIAAKQRKPCSVCGGPKEPGRSFKTCGACWAHKPDKDMEALIAEQRNEMSLGDFQPPQRFGDVHNPRSGVLHSVTLEKDHGGIDDTEIWDHHEYSEWDDPTADAALDSHLGYQCDVCGSQLDEGWWCLHGCGGD